MNYEIEGNLDFYSLLNTSNKELENDISNNNLCLISYEKLTDNSITLDCKHSFNYYPLYQEIYNQKRNFNKYFDINKKEADMISKHMFPAGLSLPKYRESWVVSIVDKGVSLCEITKKAKLQLKFVSYFFFLVFLRII